MVYMHLEDARSILYCDRVSRQLYLYARWNARLVASLVRQSEARRRYHAVRQRLPSECTLYGDTPVSACV